MAKEPYNLFSDAGSTLPGGSAYDDLLVILKGVVMQAGGSIEVDEELLMFVDHNEVLRMHEVFSDGARKRVFTIDLKHPNQNPEGHIAHTVDGEIDTSKTLSYKIGRLVAQILVYTIALIVVLFAIWLFKAVF